MTNESWPVRPLGELFEISGGKTMSAAARRGHTKTPFLRTSNVLWDQIDLTTVDEMSIPTGELREKLLQPGDMLICEGGEIGRAAIWNGEAEPMSFQNHLHRLRVLAHDVEPRFYVYFLQSGFTQLRIFEGAGNNTTIPNLSRNRLAALSVPHPSVDEQRKVVHVLSRLRDALRIQVQARNLAESLKRAAMEVLFTRGLRDEQQKETELGPVPESWEVGELGEYIQSPDYGFTASATTEPKGPRLLRITDIQHGAVEWDSVPYCICDKETLVTKRLRQNDIVVARIGATTGKAFLIRDCPEAVFASYLIRIRSREQVLAPQFLYHFMQSEAYWMYINHNKGGRLKGGVNVPVLRALPIPVPASTEQDEIIAILDAIQRKIDLHRRKHAMLDELFKTLLQKLMTRQIRVADLDMSALNQ